MKILLLLSLFLFLSSFNQHRFLQIFKAVVYGFFFIHLQLLRNGVKYVVYLSQTRSFSPFVSLFSPLFSPLSVSFHMFTAHQWIHSSLLLTSFFSSVDHHVVRMRVRVKETIFCSRNVFFLFYKTTTHAFSHLSLFILPKKKKIKKSKKSKKS